MIMILEELLHTYYVLRSSVAKILIKSKIFIYLHFL